MTAIIETYPTKFGKFASCDKETYKKLKRINRLYHECASVWMARWTRAQARQPHNRTFRLKKVEYACKDSWLFTQFWTMESRTSKRWTSTGYVDEKSSMAVPTPLLKLFQDDLYNAKHPKATAEQIVPLKLSGEQIDDLLRKIEAFAANAK